MATGFMPLCSTSADPCAGPTNPVSTTFRAFPGSSGSSVWPLANIVSAVISPSAACHKVPPCCWRLQGLVRPLKPSPLTAAQYLCRGSSSEHKTKDRTVTRQYRGRRFSSHGPERAKYTLLRACRLSPMAFRQSTFGSHASPSTKLGRMEKVFEVQVNVARQNSQDVL